MFGVWHWERDDLKKKRNVFKETSKEQVFCETLWNL